MNNIKTIDNEVVESLVGRNMLTVQDFADREIRKILDLALDMKLHRHTQKYSKLLHNKSFLMFFYNPSLRTRLSFETAMTELGGHSQFMTPDMGRFLSPEKAGESIEDSAKVMSRYVAGIGVRIEDKGRYYGEANKILGEYAKWSEIPVINMADDRFHPCQALADIMGWAECYGGGYAKPDYDALKGKTLLVTWASGGLHRSKTSPQAAMLMASRFGMNIRLSHPRGYRLENEAMGWVKQNCKRNDATFEEFVDDHEQGYEGANVIYSRHWISEDAYQGGAIQKEAEIKRALAMPEWIFNEEKNSRTDDGIFTHPMPVDRGHEVTDAIASGPRSVIYEVAENRLHVQKALMCLLMGATL